MLARLRFSQTNGCSYELCLPAAPHELEPFLRAIKVKPQSIGLFVYIVGRHSAAASDELCSMLSGVSNIRLHLLAEEPFDEADLGRWLELDISALDFDVLHESTAERGDCFMWRYLARSTTAIELSCPARYLMNIDATVALEAFAQNRSVVTVETTCGCKKITPAGMRAFADAVIARPWPINITGVFHLFQSNADAMATEVARMMCADKLASLMISSLPVSPVFTDALVHTTSLVSMYILNPPVELPAQAALDYYRIHGGGGRVVHATGTRYDVSTYWQIVQDAPISKIKKMVFLTMVWGNEAVSFDSCCTARMSRILCALDRLVDDIGPVILNHAISSHLPGTTPGSSDREALLAWISRTMSRVLEQHADTPWPVAFQDNIAELTDVLCSAESYIDTQPQDQRPCSVACADGIVKTTTGVVSVLCNMPDIDEATPIAMPEFVRTIDILGTQLALSFDTDELVRRVRAANYLRLPTLCIFAMRLWDMVYDRIGRSVSHSPSRRRKIETV